MYRTQYSVRQKQPCRTANTDSLKSGSNLSTLKFWASGQWNRSKIDPSSQSLFLDSALNQELTPDSGGPLTFETAVILELSFLVLPCKWPSVYSHVPTVNCTVRSTTPYW